MNKTSPHVRLLHLVALALLCSASLHAQSGARTFWEVAVPFSTVKAWEEGQASIGGSLVGGVRAGSRMELGAMAEWQGLPIGCMGKCGYASVGIEPAERGLSHVERFGVLSRVFLHSHPRLRGAYATLSAAMMHGRWNDETRPSIMTPAYTLGVGWRSRAAFSIDLEVGDWRNDRAGFDHGFLELSVRLRLP